MYVVVVGWAAGSKGYGWLQQASACHFRESQRKSTGLVQTLKILVPLKLCSPRQGEEGKRLKRVEPEQQEIVRSI